MAEVDTNAIPALTLDEQIYPLLRRDKKNVDWQQLPDEVYYKISKHGNGRWGTYYVQSTTT